MSASGSGSGHDGTDPHAATDRHAGDETVGGAEPRSADGAAGSGEKGGGVDGGRSGGVGSADAAGGDLPAAGATAGGGDLDAHLVVRLPGFVLDVELRAEAGSVLGLLGPNGAGKSTAVDAIAGHRRLDAGHVRVGSRVLERVGDGVRLAPGPRRIGHVPQGLLLFPGLDVRDNVAFGPMARGMRRGDARGLADRLLGELGVGAVAGRRPSELSGGQAQRVALARALATDPDLLLLDEPLGALDVLTAVEVRRVLAERLAGFGGVTVLVTHDPVDALLLADRIVVVEGGRVRQEGTAAELAARPASAYVAALVGTNLLEGVAEGTGVRVMVAGGRPASGRLEIAEPAHGRVVLTVAPNSIALHRERPETSARNVVGAVVAGIGLVGERVRVELAGAPPLTAEVTTRAFEDLGLRVGERVWVSVKSTEIAQYDR